MDHCLVGGFDWSYDGFLLKGLESGPCGAYGLLRGDANWTC